jgi:hypothetical protein
MVDAYNEKMQELVADPEKYKQQRAQETEYWQRTVLGKEGRSNTSP